MKKKIKKSLVLFLAISGIQAMDKNQPKNYVACCLEDLEKKYSRYDDESGLISKPIVQIERDIEGYIIQQSQQEKIVTEIGLEQNKIEAINNEYNHLIEEFRNKNNQKMLTDEQKLRQFSERLLMKMTSFLYKDLGFTSQDIESFLKDKQIDLKAQMKTEENNNDNSNLSNSKDYESDSGNQGAHEEDITKKGENNTTISQVLEEALNLKEKQKWDFLQSKSQMRTMLKVHIRFIIKNLNDIRINNNKKTSKIKTTYQIQEKIFKKINKRFNIRGSLKLQKEKYEAILTENCILKFIQFIETYPNQINLLMKMITFVDDKRKADLVSQHKNKKK
jgi:hypothetical protein